MDLIAINLRKHRELKGLTQAQLAAVAKVDVTAIQNIEHGRGSPTVRTLEKLADALNVNIHVFLGASPNVA